MSAYLSKMRKRVELGGRRVRDDAVIQRRMTHVVPQSSEPTNSPCLSEDMAEYGRREGVEGISEEMAQKAHIHSARAASCRGMVRGAPQCHLIAITPPGAMAHPAIAAPVSYLLQRLPRATPQILNARRLNLPRRCARENGLVAREMNYRESKLDATKLR